jgi:hypothetical protein
MNRSPLFGCPLVAASLTLLPVAARAQLLSGQTLGLNGYVGGLAPADLVYSDQFVATPGLDFTDSGGGGIIPFEVFTTDNTITVFYPASDGSGGFFISPFNGYQFTDVDNTIPTFTNATVDPSTSLPGFNASFLSFDANDVNINVSGLPFDGGDSITIDLNTSLSAPEPGALPLLAMGAAAAGGVAMLRRRNTQYRRSVTLR